MLGWSNGAFQRFSLQRQLLHLSENWKFSLVATPALVIAMTALSIHRCYYWIGTKAFLLTGALLAIGSCVLEAFGTTFWWLSVSRILAGIATSISFTLIPPYVDEFSIIKESRYSDILATAFPLGFLLRFAIDWMVPVVYYMRVPLFFTILPVCCFVGYLLLPESARFLCGTDRVSQAASVLQRMNALEPDDVRQDPVLLSVLSRWEQPPTLLGAVRGQGNLTQLVSILVLFAFNAFVGVLPMLFFLTDLLELAGNERAPMQAVTLMAVFVSVTLCWRESRRSASQWHRCLLIISSLLIAVALFVLGCHYHLRRMRTLNESGNWSMFAFGLLFAAYAVGFHRQSQVLLQSEVPDENIRFGVRTLAIAICWSSVYVAVRLFPFLLRTIGAGWLFWNGCLVALFAALLVYLAVPSADGFAHKTLPTVLRCPSSDSSAITGTPTPPSSTNCWTSVPIADHLATVPKENHVKTVNPRPLDVV